MISVIFEFRQYVGQMPKYFDIAAEIRLLLAGINEFLSIERFESMTESWEILSLSFWRDESAVNEWRQLEMHRVAQNKKRALLFQDYRLRVTEVVRDYGMFKRRMNGGCGINIVDDKLVYPVCREMALAETPISPENLLS